ncbi:MAG: ABC-2 family transporter protein [Lachnospiraceae bacterium]|nr:ABC-2 family transporter protein [Lachnospiraceae bacterium]
MKKYFSFFKMHFVCGLQYRMASLSALTTQFFWGLMECLAYRALLESSPAGLPMDYQALVSYIWLKEAFLVLFNTWAADKEFFSVIVDGGIAYEMCRPVSIYDMWFARNIGGRMATAVLKCIPLLLVAFLVPKPFRMSAPVSFGAFLLFVVTMLLGAGVTAAFCMVVYMLSFFTISPQGWRMLLTGAVDFLSGNVIPLPFIPQPYRTVMELLPFGSMQNVPFRIYSGDLAGSEIPAAIGLQLFWLCVLILCGKMICQRAQRRVVVQGG